MTFIKSEVAWLKEHARRDEDGAWWCKTTNARIRTATVGRSIHTGIFPGAGNGEVRQVVHLACEKCDAKKRPPSYGTPIVEDELTESVE